MSLRLIPADKGTHFVVGAFIVPPALLLASPLWAAAFCLAAAAAREAYGLWRHGNWSWADLAWTCAGGALVLCGVAAHALQPHWSLVL